MPTTIRTESDHVRPYMHFLVATNGTQELRHPVVLPELTVIERARVSAEVALTDRRPHPEAFREVVQRPRGPGRRTSLPNQQLVARLSAADVSLHDPSP